MPNFNNWRNWRTNLLIRLGFHDLAQNYAYDFVGNDIKEEKKEEEVDLLPTVMAWGFFKKIFRAATNVLTFGASERARRAAKRAHEDAVKQAQQSAKEYESTRSKLDKDIAGRKAAYDTQKGIEQKTLAASRKKTEEAKASQAQTELESKRAVGYSKKLAERDQRSARQATLVEQEKAARAKRESKAIGGPGVASTKVTGPTGTGSSGKAGSVSGSAKKLRKRLKDQETSLNI
jgi:hypothetical protein